MTRRPAMPNDLAVISKYARRVQSAVAAGLGSVAVLLWQHIPPAMGYVPVTTHIAIPASLFSIAEHVCRNNGGYRSVTVERKSDVFTFTCADGLSLRDTIARVK